MRKFGLLFGWIIFGWIQASPTLLAQKPNLVVKGVTPVNSRPLVRPEAPKPAPKVETIRWLSWNEAMELAKKDKRKVFVSIYLPNCPWCKKLDAETLRDPRVVQYLNENYYAVKLDAKHNANLQYKNKTYAYIRTPNGGYHELAVAFMPDAITFPSLVFLDEHLNYLQTLSKFMDGFELLPIAVFYGSDAYKETPWSAFQRDFKYPESHR